MGRYDQTGPSRGTRVRVGPAPGVRRRSGIPPLPRPDNLVVRSRLLDAIDRGVEGPLTLVSAPAGTGKTVAAATWAASGRASGPVVWIDLDDAAVRAGDLWVEVARALRRSGVWVRHKPAAAITAPHPAVIGELATEIAEHGDPVTIVLDCDVELPADMADTVHQLLTASGGQLHVVVLSRADPLLPLPRYRLSESLIEIRMADLAFTADEARELLLRRGVDLPADVVELVNERTGGWAAGLLLAAMSLIGAPDTVRAAREFSGAAGPVAEYLLTEVLDSQPGELRTLLLQTSVVEMLQPGLIEAIAGVQGRRSLAVLARRNAFLEELPAMPGRYRYHPLFRELLSAQLSYEAPTDALRLRSAAAAWYAANGMLAEAVDCATAARGWADAMRYVVEDLAVVALVIDGADGPLQQALKAAPDDTPGAEAALCRAAIALTERRHQDCAKQLHAAQVAISATPAGEQGPATLALATLLMLLASMTSAPDVAVRAAANAEHLLTGQNADRVAAHPEVSRVIDTTRARAELTLGHLDGAADAYERVVRGGLRPGSGAEYTDALGHLALLAAWRGKLRKAMRVAQSALALQGEAGLPPDDACVPAEVALGWVYVETNDLGRARRHIAKAVEGGSERVDAFTKVSLALIRSRSRRGRGDLFGARAALIEARKPGIPDWLVARLDLERARVELLDNQQEHAATVLSEMSSQQLPATGLVRAEAGLPIGRPDEPAVRHSGVAPLPDRIDKWLLESLSRIRRGEQFRAIDAADRALKLAAPERLRRPFREAPIELRRLLRTGSRLAARHPWLAGEGIEPADEQGDAGTAGVGRPAEAAAPLVIESLTAKEAEVLEYLAQLLTTDEIASAMFVSVNTIRTHVRNILRKLSVSRRNEAIRRARELGILSA